MGYNKIPWDEIIPILGKESDASIAERFKVSKSSLYDRRKVLGISAYRSQDQYDWQRIIPLLGKMTDMTISKKYKIKPQAIGEKRKELGIPKYQPKRK